MMLKSMTLMLISMSMTMSIISTPLTLGVYVLLISLLVTVMTLLLTNSWLAMVIFLVYVGGLLVLFSYFLAIQPNQKTSISTFFLLNMSTFLVLFMLINPLPHEFHHLSKEILSLPYIMLNNNLSIILILGAVLLLILIIVVKITHLKYGPLRPFL